MQVPEKLSLIGGSILLASTLVFTLKSQASHILPKVNGSVDAIYQDLTTTQNQHGIFSFKDAFKKAQQKHWKTGQWGTSKYYIDDHENMHVGQGELQGNLASVRGDQVHDTKTLSFDEPVKAPQDSNLLLASSRGYEDNDYTLRSICGLNKIDTSQVTNMTYMFGNNMALNHVDISSWDTSRVKSMQAMFVADKSLSDLNVAHLDVSNVDNFTWDFYQLPLVHFDLSSWHVNDHAKTLSMFANEQSLQFLNIQNFDDNDNIFDILGGNDGVAKNSSLSQIVVNQPNKDDKDIGLVDAQWKSGDTILHSDQLLGNHSHSGTWTKQ